MAKGDLLIRALDGGFNDTDPVTSLPTHQATIAENVEYHCSSREERSSIATRRAGISAITTPITAGADVVLLHNHNPTTDLTEAELWVVDVASGVPTVRYKDTSWHTVTQTDGITVSGTNAYDIRAQTLHGKIFITHKSGVNRLHVRDAGSSTLRRAGLDEPAAPTALDDGGVGTFSGTRYYRVRYTVQTAGVTTLRSEPSDSVTFSPNGNDTGAVVTKPTTISENETHWEVEASLDDTLFYRIATVAVGTTTYTDTTDFSTGYAVSGTLSEDSGDYALLHSAKFVIADDDRLILGSSFDDEALTSRVAWTPVLNDPGVGNDERSPIDTDNFIDLNTYEGGGLTDLSKTANGYIFAFKWGHTYQLTRTGQRTRAYTSHCLSKERGAFPGSVVEAVDQDGRPCVYFVDPQIGPCRIGNGGIQACGMDVHKTWETVNKEATVIVRSIYYPDSAQIHWWLSTDENTTPNMLLVLHIDKSRQGDDGIRYGWVKFTGGRAAAISTCLFADNVEDGAARSKKMRPYIGKIDGTIHLCDSGTDDSGTAYAARIRSGPVHLDILQKMGVMEAAMVAKAASGVIIDVSVIRDFGVEQKDYAFDLSPAGSEDPVIPFIDNFTISESSAIQIQFADQATPLGSWNIYLFAAARRTEE